ERCLNPGSTPCGSEAKMARFQTIRRAVAPLWVVLWCVLYTHGIQAQSCLSDYQKLLARDTTVVPPPVDPRPASTDEMPNESAPTVVRPRVSLRADIAAAAHTTPTAIPKAPAVLQAPEETKNALSRFTFHRKLGAGGMGAAYLVTDKLS